MVDGDGLRCPRLAWYALGERHRSALRRGDAQSQCLATQHRWWKILEGEPRQERALPRTHRLEDREEPITEARRGKCERGHGHRRDSSCLPRVAAYRSLRARNEPRAARRKLCAHVRRGAPAERARIGDLECAAQRTGAQGLFAFDRRGDAASGRATLELSHRPPDHRHVRREHEQPDEERHASRQCHPSRSAERRSAAGE
ncbi:MAG: hypothetical protein ACM3NZ_11135 [Betaproteobacteria bacterium]